MAEKNLPPHYSSLLEQLKPALLAYKIHSEDISGLAAVRMVTNQSRFTSGLVYIGTQKQFLSLRGSYLTEGAAILSCESKESILAEDPRYENVTVIELSCSAAVVFNTLTRLLSASTFTPPMETRSGLQKVWSHILASKLLSKQDIYDALQRSGAAVKPFYRVVIAAFSEARAETPRQLSLRDRLEELIPGSEVLCHKGTVVALIFEEERRTLPELPTDALEALLEDYGACLMTGRQSRDYAMMRTLYMICSRCLDIAMTMERKDSRRILDIDDYTMYYAIDMCAQRCAQVFGHMDILLLVHPSVVAIRRYDLGHGTDLLRVMESYIRNSGSIAKTAQELFVHRNTINNKVAKLRTMLPFDLDDGAVRQLLLFSCQALTYYEQMLNYEVHS